MSELKRKKEQNTKNLNCKFLIIIEFYRLDLELQKSRLTANASFLQMSSFPFQIAVF